MNADLLLLAALLPGALAGLGAVLVAAGLRRPVPRLDDAVAVLDGRIAPAGGMELPFAGGAVRRSRRDGQELSDRLVYAALGFVTPGVLMGCAVLMLGWSPWLPAGVALVGAAVGFFLPGLLARRGGTRRRADANDALFTFIDLVTLERLANRSGTQSLAAAAAMSDVAIFVEIRHVLDRARLEQRSPYPDLTRLASDLELPALADIADVMRLDESGAALTGTLRARARELRDAQLADDKIAAHAVSERMTVWMTIPSLVFALIFLIPPILRLLT